MSTAATAGPTKTLASRPARAHRISIAILGALVVVFAVLFALRGIHYYPLSGAARVASPLHRELKPSGATGRLLGVFGTGLFLLIYLYAVRKRWPWLAKRGKTKNWLDYHILLGLTVPVVITFHSAFKLQGIAGLAYWIMMAVVVSGIVGRYFYGRIPRKLDQAEMSYEEIEGMRAELAAQLGAQKMFPEEALRPLFALPPIDEVQAMPILRALFLIVKLDLRRPYVMWQLRRRVGDQAANHAELNRALELVKKQAALSKDVLFLSKMQQLFHLWHVVHRPFSYTLAAMALLHIAVVLFLGYY